MDILPLLQDGSCSITGTCEKRPHEVWGKCPQTMKCGTCIAWSPREENGYGRNSGQCMLDRDARVYLDCNAQICPYYRPRPESPAFTEWQTRPRAERKQSARRSRGKKLDREAPPPTPAALAAAAFADHPQEVADAGGPVLEAELAALGDMPVLLERFRGGGVRLLRTEGGERETSIEAFFARLSLLRRALSALEDALESSGLDDGEKKKVLKDLAGIGGSLTTFNVLFKDKADQFRGQGRG
jgi:hypothetical protein